MLDGMKGERGKVKGVRTLRNLSYKLPQKTAL